MGYSRKKPYQGVQAPVLPSGGHRREASRPDLPRAQPLTEHAATLEKRVRSSRRGRIHTEATFRRRSPRSCGKAELERFCGQLSLENQILKKSLASMHSQRGMP
jgi:transposase